jgi:hypothetical protein
VSDDIKFDFTELNQLAADLGEVKETIGPFINSAVQFTSKNVKKQAAKSVGRKRWSAAAAAIDYEVSTFQGFGASVIKSEIGYNKSKGGGDLGNLREFGAPGQNTPPSNDLLNALEANQADFQKGLEKAEKDAARKVRLL